MNDTVKHRRTSLIPKAVIVTRSRTEVGLPAGRPCGLRRRHRDAAEISPPDPLRVGEGRPAAMYVPAPQPGGGGRLILSPRSRRRERPPGLEYRT